MKFLYEYRTSDNAKHNGVICASDREAAYAELKKQGIKPSRFAEAPGFFNKLLGKGKRWLAIAVLGVAVVVSALVIHSNSRTIRTIEQSQEVFDATTRRQIIGDTAVIEKGIRTGWADVFELEGDRFLASFAIPGVPASVRSTTEGDLREALDAPSTKHQAPSTSLEERQIRAIVNGMKAELRTFLADGGTMTAYGKRLVARQEVEIGYYTRAENELKTAMSSGMSRDALSALWEQRNNSLRKLGIRLVRMPEMENLLSEKVSAQPPRVSR